MSATLTIRLDRKLQKLLDEESRKSGVRRSDLVREALQRHLAVRKFERLRRQLLPKARKRGFITDEDVFHAVS